MKSFIKIVTVLALVPLSSTFTVLVDAKAIILRKWRLKPNSTDETRDLKQCPFHVDNNSLPI